MIRFCLILFPAVIVLFSSTTFAHNITEQEMATSLNIQAIGDALEDYARHTKTYPEGNNINEVIRMLDTKNSKHLSTMDQWNYELRYIGEKNNYWIISYGPDAKADAGFYGSDGKPLAFPSLLPDETLFNDVILTNGTLWSHPLKTKSSTCRLISAKEIEGLIAEKVSPPFVDYVHETEVTYYGNDTRTSCRFEWPNFQIYLVEHEPSTFCEQQYLKYSASEPLPGIGEKAVWNEEVPNLVIIQQHKCLELTANGYSKFKGNELKDFSVKAAQIILPRI